MNLDFLPVALQKKAIYLESMCVSDYAWEYEDALKVCDIIKKQNKIILGGDVILRIQGNMKHSYDNWYMTKSELSISNISEYSVDETIKYITDYFKKNGSNYLYLIVLHT